MHPFSTIQEVQEALDALTDRDDPLVARLERQPGRKEVRYDQLLMESQQSQPLPPSDQMAPPDRLTLFDLAREVDALRGEVASLRAQVDALSEGTQEH
jgi:uncharacterized protein YceH (UPF0502 family)